jgi:hypothetical protein
MKKICVTFMVMVSVCAARGYGQFSPESLMELFDDYISEVDTTGFVFYHSGMVEPGNVWPIFKTASQGDFVQIANLDLVLREQFEDEILHMVHYKYEETYHDIPIEVAEHTEHADDGYLVYSNSKFVPDIAPIRLMGNLQLTGTRQKLDRFRSQMLLAKFCGNKNPRALNCIRLILGISLAEFILLPFQGKLWTTLLS